MQGPISQVNISLRPGEAVGMRTSSEMPNMYSWGYFNSAICVADSVDTSDLKALNG